MFDIHDFQVGMYKRLYEEELKSRNSGLSQKETKIVTTTGIRFMPNAETEFVGIPFFFSRDFINAESNGNDVRNLVIKSEVK